MNLLRPGKLLRPVRRWIAGKPLNGPTWFEGLTITQEDIDRELLRGHRDMDPEKPAPRPATVTWLGEEAKA
jgi:hypothetical protein